MQQRRTNILIPVGILTAFCLFVIITLILLCSAICDRPFVIFNPKVRISYTILVFGITASQIVIAAFKPCVRLDNILNKAVTDNILFIKETSADIVNIF